jgi:two-component system response regulator
MPNPFAIVLPLSVLLVEDNPVEVELTREVLEECKITVDMHDVHNGIDALSYLRREGKFVNARKPDLVLLDLNLPGMDGRDVLKTIKQDEALKNIPVLILTTSKDQNDISKTYNLGANCYIPKPVGFNEFSNVIQSIENFWFNTVQLPKN